MDRGICPEKVLIFLSIYNIGDIWRQADQEMGVRIEKIMNLGGRPDYTLSMGGIYAKTVNSHSYVKLSKFARGGSARPNLSIICS